MKEGGEEEEDKLRGLEKKEKVTLSGFYTFERKEKKKVCVCVLNVIIFLIFQFFFY